MGVVPAPPGGLPGLPVAGPLGPPVGATSPQGLSPWCQLLHSLVTELPGEQSPWTCPCQPLQEPGWPPQRLSSRDSCQRFPSRDRVVGGTPGAPAQRWSGPPLTASSKKLMSSWLQWGGGKSLSWDYVHNPDHPKWADKAKSMRFPCPQLGCPKVSSKYLDLKGHYQREHIGGRTAPLCDCPSGAFNSASVFADHLDMIHNVQWIGVARGSRRLWHCYRDHKYTSPSAPAPKKMRFQ